ncbi:Indoleamine 22C3-dioxygenase [gamma proteobacterium IMCC2047]|nr:Indoleamine 22C3-dioxygenase [gamma proteobacterium IMCC2047]
MRDYILKQSHNNAALVDAYNGCVLGVERFRALHLQYADQYIHQQSQSGDANPTNIGTGGTPFMRYLDKHKRESKQFLIGQ